ncbi:MAG TPA: PAS domain-containing sensor histidine kinase, partial [Desulfobacteraceae bacterium]|nr:PAS domain-containing sensor histidine kinase [Desulfobacteraceae bacterium]
YYTDQLGEVLLRISSDFIQIIDSLPDATFAIDSKGKVIAWNSIISEMTGISPKDILGKGEYEYAIPFHGMRRPMLIDFAIRPDKKYEADYLNFIRNSYGVSGEYEFHLMNNQRMYLKGKACPFYDQDKNIIGAVETMQDCSRFKEIEKTLRESAHKFKILSEESLIGLYIYEPRERTFLYVNPALASIFEREPDELIHNKDIERFVHADDLLKIQEYIEESSKGEPASTQQLFRIVTRKGDLKHIETTALPGLYNGKTVCIGTFQDITERKKIEEELLHNREYLEKIIEATASNINILEDQRRKIEMLAYSGQVAARVAHEINNPLAGIKNSFLLIKEAVSPDHPYHHYAELIEKEINRLASITKQMFGLFNPEHIPGKKFEFNDLIKDILIFLESTRRELDVSIITPSTQISIDQIPESLLRQILYNLLINALEASKPGGEIIIHAAIENAGMVFSISDNGHGIPDEIKPYIFDPFFSTKKGEKKGLGLGLSITKKLIEEWNGTMSLETKPGFGTKLIIFLPKKDHKRLE